MKISSNAIMDLIVGEDNDKVTYRGSSGTYLASVNEMPAFYGATTMTVRISRMVSPLAFKAEVTVDPEISGGVPSVGHTNEPISHILEKLAMGISPEMLITANPGLSLLDIQLALKAASWVMRDPSIDWETLDLNGMLAYQDELKSWQSLNEQTLGNTYTTEQ